MPGSRLAIFDGVGHYPHCEDPERFVQVLIDFIESTAPAQLSAVRWRELFQPPAESHAAPTATAEMPSPAGAAVLAGAGI